MDAKPANDGFYAALPVFSDFTQVTDESCFRPLPDDWVVGTADIVGSTKAIAENRYKAVNMAGAAVIVSITNALFGRDFPFVFGGDGASFAVAGADSEAARRAASASAADTAKLAPSPPNTKGKSRPASALVIATITAAPAMFTAL